MASVEGLLGTLFSKALLSFLSYILHQSALLVNIA